MTQHPGKFIASGPLPAAVDLAPPAHAAHRRRGVRPFLIAAAGLAAIAAGGVYGREYWTVWRFEVSTDDAYVQTDNTTVAPKVSGYIGRCSSRTTNPSRPASYWPRSTTGTSASRSIPRGPTSPPLRPPYCPSADAGRAGRGDRLG